MYEQDKDNILEKINKIKNDIRNIEEKIKIKSGERFEAIMTKKFDLVSSLGEENFNLIFDKQNLKKTLDQLNENLEQSKLTNTKND